MATTCIFCIIYDMNMILPSVLWCCWLGGRKGIWSISYSLPIILLSGAAVVEAA